MTDDESRVIAEAEYLNEVETLVQQIPCDVRRELANRGIDVAQLVRDRAAYVLTVG